MCSHLRSTHSWAQTFWESKEGRPSFKPSQSLGRVPHSQIQALLHPLFTHLQEAEQLDLVVFLFLEGDGDVRLHRDPSLHPGLLQPLTQPHSLGNSILHPDHLFVPHRSQDQGR